jgi:hypothetical protein
LTAWRKRLPGAPGLKEVQLIACLRRSLELACVEVILFESQFETLIEEVSIGAEPNGSLTPSRIVHRTPACLPYKAEQMIRGVKVMAFQPFLGEIRNLKW